jgi:hypothetical protein
VFEVGETVMLFPVPTDVPPQEPENHSAVAPVPAEPPLKVRVVVPPEQIVVVPVILVGATESVFTDKIAELEFKRHGDAELTTTSKLAPFSAIVGLAIVKVAVVTPL